MVSISSSSHIMILERPSYGHLDGVWQRTWLHNENMDDAHPTDARHWPTHYKLEVSTFFLYCLISVLTNCLGFVHTFISMKVDCEQTKHIRPIPKRWTYKASTHIYWYLYNATRWRVFSQNCRKLTVRSISFGVRWDSILGEASKWRGHQIRLTCMQLFTVILWFIFYP